MSTNCNISTTVVPDNTPLECDQYYSTVCVINPNALAYLGLPSNSTQEDINIAINLALINTNNKIIQLQNEVVSFENADLDIDGTYFLSPTDDKKYITINSAINTPRIALDEALPDGFECYFVHNVPYDSEDSNPSTILMITPEFVTAPLFTVPLSFGDQLETVQNYGIIFVKKINSNLYTVTGSLYRYGS